MATIDNLDIGVYFQYAQRSQMMEQVEKQYHIKDASAIPPQTSLLDLYPKLSELDLLLGVSRSQAAWAFFYPPKKFKKQRRSPFSFSRVIPSFGDEEEQEEDTQYLEEFKCKTKEEERERKTLLKCMKQVEEINDWMSDIIGRIGQFLQG